MLKIALSVPILAISFQTFANNSAELTAPDPLKIIEEQSLNVAWGIIKHYEKCKTKPYRDQAGISTIGYGERAKGRKSITCKQSEENVKAYIRKDIVTLKEYEFFANDEFNANQMGAILSLTFNIGVDAFLASRQNVHSSSWWQSFANVNGTVSRGLESRRKHEYAIFTKNP